MEEGTTIRKFRETIIGIHLVRHQQIFNLYHNIARNLDKIVTAPV